MKKATTKKATTKLRISAHRFRKMGNNSNLKSVKSALKTYNTCHNCAEWGKKLQYI